MEVDLARQSLAIAVREHHDVGDARRQALQAAKDLRFDETVSGRVGIIATELAGNLVKHAGGGRLILRVLEAGGERGLELMALDNGPGMDVQRCMEDGYSTAGSPGTGLGAIKRLAASLDIYSLRDSGTVVVTSLWPGAAPVEAFDIGAVCLPVAGERLCGDGWAARQSSEGLDLMMCDGLGHGPIAAEATDAALATFAARPGVPPGDMLDLLHGALRSTRGAAVLSVQLDTSANVLTCSGVGNIAGYVMASPKPRGVVSMNGIVGHQMSKPKSFSYDCGPNELVILHSDGVTTHWKLDDFPGLTSRSAGLIAGMMYKHFTRGRDDATIVVARRR